MAATNYALGRDSSFRASGRYPKHLEGESPEDPRPAIRRLVELFSEIQKLHGRTIAGDGQIVGTERSKLLAHVDTAIVAAVVLVRKLTPQGSAAFTVGTEPQERLAFDFDIDGWTMEGFLPRRLSSFRGTLPEYYGTEFAPPFKAFLQEYKAQAVDGLVSEGEKAALFPLLRDILLASLKLYFLLYYMHINS